MPTYDYQCSNGHQFESLQSIISEPLSECLVCGGPVRRLIGGGIGVIFKGSGFYVTDSKNGDPKKKPDVKDSESGDTKKEKDSTKPESKKKDTKSSNSDGGETSKSAAKTKT